MASARVMPRSIAQNALKIGDHAGRSFKVAQCADVAWMQKAAAFHPVEAEPLPVRR
jgi:hypothetical protein